MESETNRGIDYFAARVNVGMSLSTVAQATGIAPAQLILFEQEKADLSQQYQKALQTLYTRAGYRFAAPQPVNDDDVIDPYLQLKSAVKVILNQDSQTGQALLALVDRLDNLLALHAYHRASGKIPKPEQFEWIPPVAESQENQALFSQYQQTEHRLLALLAADQPESRRGQGIRLTQHRTDTYLALLALQHLRLIKALHPELLTVRYSTAVADSDNARILRRIITHLEHDSRQMPEERPELQQILALIR